LADWAAASAINPRLVAIGMLTRCIASAAVLLSKPLRVKFECLLCVMALPLNEVVGAAHHHQNSCIDAVEQACFSGC
jgi:hypothetical protein